MREKINTNLIHGVLIFMGFVVFSPFSSILIMDWIGLSFSVPELLFIPFALVLRKRYYFEPINLLQATILVYFWFILVIISIFESKYSIYSILASSRTYLTLLISYIYFSNYNSVKLRDIMLISLGSTIGWLFSSLYQLSNYYMGTLEIISVTGNMLTMPLLLCIAIIKNQKMILIFALILCVFIGLTSGMRRQVFIFLVSLLLIYGLLIFRNFKKFILYLLPFAFLLLVFILLFPKIENYLLNSNPNIHYRIIYKTRMLITSNDKVQGDNERLAIISRTIESMSENLFPRGFVSRKTNIDDTGKFIDFPLSELLYMLGLSFTALLILVIIKKIFLCVFFNYVEDSVIFGIIAIIMLILLFIEGTFLSSSYTSPITGYCLGRLYYYSKFSRLSVGLVHKEHLR